VGARVAVALGAGKGVKLGAGVAMGRFVGLRRRAAAGVTLGVAVGGGLAVAVAEGLGVRDGTSVGRGGSGLLHAVSRVSSSGARRGFINADRCLARVGIIRVGLLPKEGNQAHDVGAGHPLIEAHARRRRLHGAQVVVEVLQAARAGHDVQKMRGEQF